MRKLTVSERDFNMKNIYISSCVPEGGVYRYNLTDGGKLEFADKLSVDSPMYHIFDGKKMYIILRAPFKDNKDSGLISADVADYRLVNPSEPVSTKGIVACHLCKEEDDIYCVNYVSGSVIKMPDKLDIHEGNGPNRERQESAHTHFVTVSPDKKYVLVTDLGTDKIFVYNRSLELVRTVDAPSGHGVRHLIFSEDSRYLFAVNELESTVSAYSYNDGRLEIIDTVSALPEDFDGFSIAAAIRLRKGHIFVSNRGHDSLAELNFDGKKLKLLNTYPCGGAEPRDFDFFGDYVIFANIAGNNVTVFRITENGLEQTDDIALEQPLCVSTID